ncbi:MAG: DNA photolyase [Myxococcota bacterium]|nr:DNA photolyase [Myxococcota bacterium]
MSDHIYVEQSIRTHPRTQRILAKFAGAAVIDIERYGEVFNRKNQNFRLQKKKPALIVARKHAGHVLATPPGYGIGGRHNYYFSHLLNCLYDCRYCFLQGMYRSAHYVLFVNYDDFVGAIDDVLARHDQDPVYFFSGYDCDSLALESITGFADYILPVIRARPRAWLELRTKSIQSRPLLDVEPCERVVVAFSLTPSHMAAAVEHGAPSVERRIELMSKLAHHGWPIGLRFDPLLTGVDWRAQYDALFDAVFARVPAARIHSVSYGPLRFPKAMYRDIIKLYPESPLFAEEMTVDAGMASYPETLENEMADYCHERLQRYVPESVFFQCTPESAK